MENWNIIPNGTIVVDFNTTLTLMDMTSYVIQTENQQGRVTLNGTWNQMVLTDIYRTRHPERAEYIIFMKETCFLDRITY